MFKSLLPTDVAALDSLNRRTNAAPVLAMIWQQPGDELSLSFSSEPRKVSSGH